MRPDGQFVTMKYYRLELGTKSVKKSLDYHPESLKLLLLLQLAVLRHTLTQKDAATQCEAMRTKP